MTLQPRVHLRQGGSRDELATHEDENAPMYRPPNRAVSPRHEARSPDYVVDKYGRLHEPPAMPAEDAWSAEKSDKALGWVYVAISVVTGVAAVILCRELYFPAMLLAGLACIFFAFCAATMFDRWNNVVPAVPLRATDIDHFTEKEPYGSAGYAGAAQIDRALRGQGGGAGGPAEPPKFFD